MQYEFLQQDKLQAASADLRANELDKLLDRKKLSLKELLSETVRPTRRARAELFSWGEISEAAQQELAPLLEHFSMSTGLRVQFFLKFENGKVRAVFPVSDDYSELSGPILAPMLSSVYDDAKYALPSDETPPLEDVAVRLPKFAHDKLGRKTYNKCGDHTNFNATHDEHSCFYFWETLSEELKARETIHSTQVDLRRSAIAHELAEKTIRLLLEIAETEVDEVMKALDEAIVEGKLAR